MNILIIDEDKESNLKVKRVLEQNYPDIKVRESENLREAFSIIEEYRPSIVLIELSVADGDGIEFGEKITKRYMNVHVVAITHLKMFDLVYDCINKGFSGFHIKPITKHDFIKNFDHLISSIRIKNSTNAPAIFQNNDTDKFEADMAMPIKTAIEYINLNYYNPITLKEISEIVYLSPSHFSRMFKEEMGVSFIEFLTEVRVEKSKQYLKESTVPIEVIAHNIGFSSSTYFSTTFKKIQGKTPREYRSLYRKLEDNEK